MNTISQLARNYRKLCKQVRQADDRIQKAKSHVHELVKARHHITQELEQLKTVLDYCVISGDNPTQAQLSHTLEQMNHAIHEHRRHVRAESDYIYTSNLGNVTINNMVPHNHILSGKICAPVTTAYTNMATTNSIQDEIDPIQDSASTMP
jgi:regulator of replication initiation timing